MNGFCYNHNKLYLPNYLHLFLASVSKVWIFSLVIIQKLIKFILREPRRGYFKVEAETEPRKGGDGSLRTIWPTPPKHDGLPTLPTPRHQ